MDDSIPDELRIFAREPERNRDIVGAESSPPNSSETILLLGASWLNRPIKEMVSLECEPMRGDAENDGRRVRLSEKNTWVPSPQEIRAACLEIQACWSEQERLSRAQCAVRRERQITRGSRKSG